MWALDSRSSIIKGGPNFNSRSLALHFMNPTHNPSSHSRLQSFQDEIPEHPQSTDTTHDEQSLGEVGIAIPEHFNASSHDETAFQTSPPFWQTSVSQQQPEPLDEQTAENFASGTVQYSNINPPPAQSSSAKAVPNPSYPDGPRMRIFNAVFTDWSDLNQQNKFNVARKKGTDALHPLLNLSHSWSELRRDLKETVVDVFIKEFMNALRYVCLRLSFCLILSVTRLSKMV